MSRTSNSLELTEFFNNDESDGLRLAEFLQQRRGGVQRQHFLFMNCEPQRYSLNVQVEKIAPNIEEQHSTARSENNTNDNNVGKEKEKTIGKLKQSKDKAIVKEDNELAAVSNGMCAAEDNSSSYNHKSEQNILSNGVCSRAMLSLRDRNMKKSSIPIVNPSIPACPFKHFSRSKPLSPRTRISEGASTSDRLRRYTLNRLSKAFNRRTLLQEFESTVSDSNFDPPVCSTPRSQPTPSQPTSLLISNHNSVSEKAVPNTAENNSNAANNSCHAHTDTIIRSLQRREEELHNYMNSIMEKTLSNIQSQIDKTNCSEKEKHTSKTFDIIKSPPKRRYTVENGLKGQVILTPEKRSNIENMESSRQLRVKATSTSSKILQASGKKDHSVTSIRINCPQNILSSEHVNKSPIKNCSDRADNMLSTSKRREPLNSKKIEHEKSYSNNVSIVFPTQDVVDVGLPETEYISAKKNNTVDIHSNNKEMPLVIIPITQNFVATNINENGDNNKVATKTQTNKDHLNKLSVDNLKLTDIITDDEEETPKAVFMQRSLETSQAPLNLAPSDTNLRNKRLRNRSMSRRRLQMDKSQNLSAAIATKKPPSAHSNCNSINPKRIFRKTQIPLNKAPGMPLNGEQFAVELTGMSNHEILDLRKRNSLGNIFAISGRKFTRGFEKAAQKQRDLDDQIELELLRRNFQESQKQHVNDENATKEKEELQNEIYEECPLVPVEFRDSLVRCQKEDFRESSFIDEKSTDRISFKNPKIKSSNEKNLRRGKRREMPELLKHYLEVPKKITRKKKQSRSINQTKRSLYSKDLSLEGNTSEENSFEGIEINNGDSIPCVPSPPKSNNNEITIIKVVPPPPALTPLAASLPTEHEVLQVVPANGKENESLLPPPPEFGDLGISSNKSINNYTSSTTVQLVDCNKKSDEEIFKKPMQPPPKRRQLKPKTLKPSSNDLLQTAVRENQQLHEVADEADSTLRRSKRGQVPLKNPYPILKMIMAQNQQKQRSEQRQKYKNKKLLDTNMKSDKSNLSKSSFPSKRTRAKNPLLTIPENEQLEVPLNQNTKIAQKKSANKKNANAKRKQENYKISHTSANETIQRVYLTDPPPLDHLNNVFDQLRNLNSSIPSRPITNQSIQKIHQKIKPLRVRIARLKSSSQILNTETYEASSTNKTLDNLESRLRSSTSCSIQSQGSLMTTNNDSNHELIVWLKNVSESNSMNERNEAIFKQMRISAAANLSFTELQGVEYAFYDTDEKASLGYLRFKPRQIKPKKRAKLFHLHFITLLGKFRIKANNEESILNVGDMVAVDKFVYYHIENLTDSIGILMVIKK